jgi:hypothetical protein
VPPAKERIVEWYRADPWPRIRPFLFGGPTLLTLGGIVIAVSFLTHQPNSVRVESAAIGFLLVATGATITMVGMYGVLREEVYLALRTDGLALRVKGVETLVAWDDVREVRWDAAAAALVIERDGGEPLVFDRPLAGIEGPALPEVIERTKRRIAMRLVR